MNLAGSWLLVAQDTILAATAKPCASATLALVTTKAAAPSEMDEAFAAVIVPSFANAGFSVGILSGFALPGCSSISTTVVPPRPATSTATISDAKAPDEIASFARVRERSAYSS